MATGIMKNSINVLTGFALAIALLYLTYDLTKNLVFVVIGGLPILLATPYATYRTQIPFRSKRKQ